MEAGDWLRSADLQTCSRQRVHNMSDKQISKLDEDRGSAVTVDVLTSSHLKSQMKK